MTQWENLPEPVPQRQVARVTPSWAGFSADPRQVANQPLRASDADRDFATRLLDQAFTEGRLDATEHGARVSTALASRTLGELGPLVSDLMVAHAAPPGASRRGARGFLRGWVGLAVLFNAIWLITVVTTGHFLYYWPIWPMLGTALPLFMARGFVGGSRDTEWDARRAEYRAARHQARDDRHALRHQARALRRGQVPQLPPPPPEQDLR